MDFIVQNVEFIKLSAKLSFSVTLTHGFKNLFLISSFSLAYECRNGVIRNRV